MQYVNVMEYFEKGKIIVKSTEAYKGHFVLCKDVLSFVFQYYDFQVLCFGFCVLCPVLFNKRRDGDIKRKR